MHDALSTSCRMAFNYFRNSAGELTDGIIMMHDNAHSPYMAHTVQEQGNSMRWAVLTHPGYSLELPPCDLHILGWVNRDLNFRVGQRRAGGYGAVV